MNLKINVPEHPALAVKMLMDAGFEAGVVGGCIRDAIMGEIADDWDICTSATPDEIQTVFKDFKQLLVGLKHGTVIIIMSSEPIEVTTYRIDGEYSDGRRPNDVSFTKNLTEDLSRRDYTQNALFFNEVVGIIDPFNGVHDIENETIRCVGDPDKRLQEDALRILRGIRFASKLGFKIEEATKSAMFKNKALLESVSKERITVEFIKLLQGKNATHVLDEFQEIIAYIIPETKAMMGFLQNNPYHIYDVWKHTLLAMDYVDDLILKLALFFHDIGKPSCYTLDDKNIGHFYDHTDVSSAMTSEIFTRMKITNAQGLNKNDIKDILELIKYHDSIIKPKKQSVRKMLSKLEGNKKQFERLLLIMRANISAQNPDKLSKRLKSIDTLETIFNEVIENNDCTTISALAVTGSDLIQIGIPNGVKIGEILNQLLDAVINDYIPNEKNALLLSAKKYQK